MKKMIIVIVAIALTGGIIFGIISYFKKSNDIAPNIKTAIVQRGDLVVKVTETGRVEPKTTVEIKSKVGGEIVRLPVKEGDGVKKGDLLVEMDTTDLRSRLNQAKADLEAVKAKLSALLAGERPQEIARARESLKQTEIRLSDASLKLDRQKELFSQGFISKQEVDTAQKEYELAQSSCNAASQQLSLVLEGAREQDIASARATVLRAEAGHEQALQDLKDAKIYAPLAGTIIEKNVEEGEVITSGMTNTGGGTLILIIADLSKMMVKTDINEVDIAKIKTGQAVEITLDAIREKTYHGRVTDIASSGKIEGNIVTYEVTIEILDADKRLKPAMTADVDIIAAERKDVLYAPLEAIIEKGRRKEVFVIKDGKFTPRQIKTGLQDETSVEIIEGLTKGEEVKLNSLTSKNEESGSLGRSRSPGHMPGMGRR